MAKFCGKCGTQLSDDSAFCNTCGTPVTASAPPFESVPATPFQPVPHSYTQTPAKHGNTGLKIALLVLAVFAVAAFALLGGMFYLGHKAITKIEDKAASAGLSADQLDRTGPAFHGDACRFLSSQEVSKATGVPIVEARSSGNLCTYLVRGTTSGMSSKHLSQIMNKYGASKEQQEKISKIAGDLFTPQQRNSAEAALTRGMTSVLSISIDENAARSQMKLSSKVLGALDSASSSENLEGIGDEALVAGNGIMLVRKGDTLLRFTYISCPCNTEQIKPLAKKLADAF